MNLLHQPIGGKASVAFVAAAIALPLTFAALGDDCYLSDLPKNTAPATHRGRGSQADMFLLDAFQPVMETYDSKEEAQSAQPCGRGRYPGSDSVPCSSGTLLEQLVILALR